MPDTKLDLKRMLPKPEDHESYVIERCASTTATEIMNAMSENKKQIFCYNLHPEVIRTLIQLGYLVQPTGKNFNEIDSVEYEVTW